MKTPDREVSILYVEDDKDLRGAIADLLEAEGYAVTAVGSAEEGLERLTARGFDLVLSDFHLPGQTGGWMLEQARASGLLEHVPALVLTAERQAKLPPGIRLLRKPFDLEELLQAMADLLAAVGARRLEAHGQEEPEEQQTVRTQLVLYIAGPTPSSHRALRRLDRILARYAPEQVCLRILDLSRTPLPQDVPPPVPFTPALLRLEPAPRSWVLGDLRDEEPVEDLLESAGVEHVP